MDILSEISNIGIVPVIALDNANQAVPLAKALIDGGLPCAEVTFRTAAAEESIRQMARHCPDMLVGAGTILTPEQADKAVAAGARFIVSPGLNEEVVKHCQKIGVPIIAGVATPSEVEKALSLGLTTLKFFPAEAAGGLAMIKAMSAPYSQVKFMPTGGINAKNVNSYLSFKKVIACGGSWMVSKELINSGNFAEITRLTKEAVATMLGFELRHVGINCSDEQESSAVASQFEKLFGFSKEDRGGAYFAGEFIEVMKKPFYGAKGHIAIATHYPQRAAYRLEKAGIKLNWDSAGYNPDGSLRVVYLKDEVGGFALHILQK
ncbi:MAG: bifunctional 4-hydroxy-2-oxoglutarate aldolase/2-dehydro-3-deoxy-phosphogluconate aldolase [Elusimicrobiaceae bacterium]|nr:bifunctional 4-hydroxy-2-oxoglutarate aldolase/2-dehydro-3-deoxy-phosphogluconate aldolase [Elusimicrobiaceae bacterium]